MVLCGRRSFHIGSRATMCATMCAAILASCASVDTTPDYDRVVHEIRTATGVEHVYHPDDEKDLEERVVELLVGGLELREAVELGLLRNPLLQASFRSVGIAKADRVQAGLLTNPSLSAALRFPVDGGVTQIEGGLLAPLLDIWQIPARTRVAQSALERSVLELAHSAVQLAAKIRVAYLEALASERLLVIAQENLNAARRLVELVDTRLHLAAATAIDKNLAELELLDTRVALRDARFDVGDKIRRLTALLGYDRTPSGFRLSGVLPDSSDTLPGIEILRKIARERRLDVRAARARVQEAVAELSRQHGLKAGVPQVGLDAERGDDWALGPGVRLELPIFDQNQAQVARAVASLAQQQRLLQAVELSVSQDVSSVLARAQASWDTARLYGDQVRRAQETMDLTRQSFEAGKTTIVLVVEAQRKLLSARRMQALRLRSAASAVSDLERATGTPREQLLNAKDPKDRKEP